MSSEKFGDKLQYLLNKLLQKFSALLRHLRQTLRKRAYFQFRLLCLCCVDWSNKFSQVYIYEGNFDRIVSLKCLFYSLLLWAAVYMLILETSRSSCQALWRPRATHAVWSSLDTNPINLSPQVICWYFMLLMNSFHCLDFLSVLWL